MEEKINQKIKEIKKIILEITQGFPYTKEQINWLTIVYLSFIMLDDEIEDLLMETLHEVFIVFAHDTVKNTYQRLMHNKYDKKFLRELMNDRAIYFNYLVDETGLHGNPFIIIPIDKIPLYDIFDSLFHELKHAINERIPHFFNQK